jgi:hypothetical protein
MHHMRLIVIPCSFSALRVSHSLIRTQSTLIMDRLPFEILTIIFMYRQLYEYEWYTKNVTSYGFALIQGLSTSASDWNALPRPNRCLIPLIRVCRRWRSVIYQSGCLWQRFGLDLRGFNIPLQSKWSAFVADAVANSRRFPLHLILVVHGNVRRDLDMKTRLLLRRASSAVIGCRIRDDTPIYPLLRAMPQLVSLEFDTLAIRIPLPSGELPKLQHLVVHDNHHCSVYLARFTRTLDSVKTLKVVTHRRIKGVMGRVVGNMPQLEELTIEAQRVQPLFWQQMTSANLKALRTVTVNTKFAKVIGEADRSKFRERHSFVLLLCNDQNM